MMIFVFAPMCHKDAAPLAAAATLAMLILFALVTPVLLLFAGLAIDVGMLENRSLAMQAAADAAATAAQFELERGSATWDSVGRQVSALNGFADGVNSVAITLTQKPATGLYATRNDAVEVIVRQTAPTFFMRLMSSAVPLSVRSVAVVPPCVFLNGSAGGQALTGQGAQMPGNCPFYFTGDAQLDGSSQMATMAVGMAAGASYSGPTPDSLTSNAPLLADPLTNIAQPSGSACTTTGFHQNGGTAQLTPGVFCGGMSIQNATVQLSPGLYVIAGGAHWSGATVSGTGVTLFFTAGPDGAFGQFNVDGNSVITLSAPADDASGAVPGMLVFADQAWTPSSRQDFRITNSTWHGDGIWYTTRTGMQLSNSRVTADRYLGIDTASLVLTNSTLTPAGDFSPVSTGSPFRRLGGLAE